MTMSDPYSTLGVSPESSDQEIKKAFRSLAVKYHPDRGGDENKFKEINEAYDKIKTAEKRQQFEASKRFGGDGFSFSFNQDGGDMQDIFNQFFGGDPFGRQRRPYRRKPTNKNLQINLEMTLEQAYTGIKKTVHIDQLNGEVEINIPKGIDHGQTVRFKGLGLNNVAEAPPGDLLVKIYMQRHPFIVRQKLDLHTEISVNCFEAINGTSKDVRTIDGKIIKLKVAPGTQPGTVMRMARYGMEHNTRVGDYFVRINVSIPKNLKEEDRDAIRDIGKTYS